MFFLGPVGEWSREIHWSGIVLMMAETESRLSLRPKWGKGMKFRKRFLKQSVYVWERNSWRKQPFILHWLNKKVGQAGKIPLTIRNNRSLLSLPSYFHSDGVLIFMVTIGNLKALSALSGIFVPVCWSAKREAVTDFLCLGLLNSSCQHSLWKRKPRKILANHFHIGYLYCTWNCFFISSANPFLSFLSPLLELAIFLLYCFRTCSFLLSWAQFFRRSDYT